MSRTGRRLAALCALLVLAGCQTPAATAPQAGTTTILGSTTVTTSGSVRAEAQYVK